MRKRQGMEPSTERGNEGRRHRYPGADQPQEIVPEVLLRFWGRDITGEHAQMRFDPGG